MFGRYIVYKEIPVEPVHFVLAINRIAPRVSVMALRLGATDVAHVLDMLHSASFVVVPLRDYTSADITPYQVTAGHVSMLTCVPHADQRSAPTSHL